MFLIIFKKKKLIYKQKVNKLKFRSFLAMVSLRFPFSFSGSPNPLPNPNRSPRSSRRFSPAIAFAAAAAFGVGMSFAVGRKLSTNQTDGSAEKPSRSEAPVWASLSLTGAPAETAVEPRTGVAFPAVLDGSRRLLGVGLRRKNILGLKNIDVYAFGIAFSTLFGIRQCSSKFSIFISNSVIYTLKILDGFAYIH